MDSTAIVETYVGDVVRRLPRRQRNDVARELRSLLDEEIAGSAAASGRAVDVALTMELLTAFGRPHDVADRYRPEGFTIIPPAQAPRFAWIALGGVLLQWAITLPATLLGVIPVLGWEYGADEWWGRLSAWWLGAGLGAFWWPGVMITYTLIAALMGAHREAEAKPWAPASARAIDRDLVNRLATVIGLSLGLLGATALIALPSIGSWATALPQTAVQALSLDPGFLLWRAPWVLLLWVAMYALEIRILVIGRWTRLTLRLRALLDLLLVVLLVVWIAAGPIFIAPFADGTTKAILAVVAGYALVDAVLALRRGGRGAVVSLR